MTALMIILAGLCAGIAMASAIGFDRGGAPRVDRAQSRSPRVSRRVRRRDRAMTATTATQVPGRHLQLVAPVAGDLVEWERIAAASMARPILRLVPVAAFEHRELQPAERTGS